MTDCKSVLENLQAPAKDENTQSLQSALFNLSEQCTIALQWIPSHCQIDGNERADRLSKSGSKQEQFEHPVSYPEAKTLVKSQFQQNWKTLHNHNKETSLKGLGRKEQTTIFRLRTGHCRLRHHLYRLKISHTDECPCGTGVQDPEHILQNCPTYVLERNRIWPQGASYQEKLWGPAAQLRATASFIGNIGLNV